MERRSIPGGPAKATVRKKIAAEKKKLVSDGRELAAANEKIEKAYASLTQAAGGIAGKRK